MARFLELTKPSRKLSISAILLAPSSRTGSPHCTPTIPTAWFLRAIQQMAVLFLLQLQHGISTVHDSTSPCALEIRPTLDHSKHLVHTHPGPNFCKLSNLYSRELASIFH